MIGELPFDLDADPGETRDLAAEMPLQADELRRRMQALDASVARP